MINRLRFTLAVTIGVLIVASLIPGIAFAAVPPNGTLATNGLQITYDISGINLGSSNDAITTTPSFSDKTLERDFTGTLSGGMLTVSGTVGGVNGDWMAQVQVGVDNTVKNWFENLLDISANAGTSKSFSVSVPIPSGAKTGYFSIEVNYCEVEINYSGVDRLIVQESKEVTTSSGSASNPPGSVAPVSGQVPPPTGSKSSTPWGVIIPLALLIGVTLTVTVSTVAIIAAGPTIFGEGTLMALATYLATNPATGPIFAFLYTGLSQLTLTNIPVLKLVIDKLAGPAQKVLEFLQNRVPSKRFYSTSYGETDSSGQTGWRKPAGAKFNF